MKSFFPPQNQSFRFLQTNRSDVLGSLWSSFNIDLQSNLGVVRVAPRLKINTQTSDQANLGSPAAFKFFDNRYFAICGARIFKNSGYKPSLGFSEDTSTGVQTNYLPENSDLEVYLDKLWATGNGALYYKDRNGSGTGAWTSHSTVPDASVNLMVFGRKFNRLYLTTNSSQVDSTDGTTYASTGDYTINLGVSDENNITAICETSEGIWLGTTNISNENGRGSVYFWDGKSSVATKRYYLNAPGAYALVTYNDIPYVMDTFGIFSKFNGTNFQEIGRLPFSDLLLADSSTGFSTFNDRFIHPKGIIPTRNGTFLALIFNNYDNTDNTISENCPSGIYEFSEETGFVHKHALTYNTVGSLSVTDFGQNRIGTKSVDPFVGALVQAWTPDDGSRNGMIMCGATFFTNATAQTSAIFIDDSLNTTAKRGYFVTTWFNSEGIKDNWVSVWSQYRRLLDSSDSIVVKYRFFDEPAVSADITWVNTTSFTTTTDISAYWTSGTGFEVEIIQGTGSGLCAHITNIVLAGGTYTVTIDETATGVTTGTARARFQKWIKLDAISGQVEEHSRGSITLPSSRIQVKVAMAFTGDDEFHKLSILSTDNIKII